MTLATHSSLTLQSPRAGRNWRCAVEIYDVAVRDHQACLDAQAQLWVVYETSRPFFPEPLREALFQGTSSVRGRLDELSEYELPALLAERHHTGSKAASLIACFTQWREACNRVAQAVGLSANFELTHKALVARDEAYRVVLETPPPDLHALAEKLQLVADQHKGSTLWWEDAAILAQDTRRLCGRL